MDLPENSSQHSIDEIHLRLDRFLGFLKIDAKNISLRLDTIELAIQCQSWEAADAIIGDGLLLHPEDAKLHAYAGIVSLKNQKFSLASEQFEFSINHSDSPDGAILYNYAFALFYCAHYEKALSILNSVTAAKDELLTSVLKLSARCLHHLDRRDEAINLISQLTIDLYDAEIKGLLALLLYEAGKPDEALLYANNALIETPQQLDALLARASIESESGNYLAAHVDYAAAVETHPTCGRAWSGLGQISLYNFQFDKAQEEFEVAVKYMPDHIGTWHLLAWIHIMNNRPDDAKYAFDRAYDIDRNFGETHGGLAVVAAMRHEKNLAEQYIRRAKKLNPNGFSVYYAEILLLNNDGKENEAKALYDKVMLTAQLPSSSKNSLGDLVKQRLIELQEKNTKTLH